MESRAPKTKESKKSKEGKQKEGRKDLSVHELIVTEKREWEKIDPAVRTLPSLV